MDLLTDINEDSVLSNTETREFQAEYNIYPNMTDYLMVKLEAYDTHIGTIFTYEEVELYLQYPNNHINYRIPNGYTALHTAVDLNNVPAMHTLLAFGADVNIANNNNYTPLMTACSNGNREVVYTLLQHGADFNLSDVDNETAMHAAVDQERQEWVSGGSIMLLLEAGAEINSMNNHGESVLHIAAHRGFDRVAEFLVRNGAIVFNNHQNQDPIDIAQNNGHHNIADMLRRYFPQDEGY